MDRLASVLLEFPPAGEDLGGVLPDVYDTKIRHHARRLQKLFKESSTMHLNPAVQTYSYLLLLDTVVPSDTALLDMLDPAIVDKILAFLVAFDPRQVRYIGSAFTYVFAAVASGRLIPAPVAVPVLAKALERIDPSGSTFTTNHLALARLAYHTNNIPPALPFLGRDIVFYPGPNNTRGGQPFLSSLTLAPPVYISKDTGLTLPIRTSQVLEYDYLLGLMYSSVRNWKAAHTAFARVVSFPTRETGVSKVMVEAHKKWVLTGLLLHGSVSSAPPLTANHASKVCSALNKVYLQIADKFAAFDADGLQKEIGLGGDVFATDSNQHLLAEVLAAHPKWQVASLRKVYSKIPISNVRQLIKKPAGSTGLATDAEMEALVQGMIDGGMIKAVIRTGPTEAQSATAQTTTTSSSTATTTTTPSSSPSPHYLEFLPETNELSETEFARRLAEASAQLHSLKPLYATADEQLSLNKDYLRQVIKDRKREQEAADRLGSGITGSSAGGYDSVYSGDVDDDEDLMTDVMTGY